MADWMANVRTARGQEIVLLSVPQVGVEPTTFRLGGEGCYTSCVSIERVWPVILAGFTRDPK